MKRYLPILVVLALMSCKKETPAPLVTVKPSAINFASYAGEVVSFGVEVESEEALDQFTITSKTGTSFTEVELDQDISGKLLYATTFEYLITEDLVGQDKLFTFTATTTTGLSGSAARRVIVVETEDSLLVEQSGLVIYSTHSGKEDGYSFKNNQSQLVATGVATEIQIADFDTIVSDSVMTSAWYSPSGAKFARFNDFDYASATAESAEAAFATSNQHDIITNLQAGDIILVKYGDGSQYAVVRVEQIFQDVGSSLDRYNFSLKK